MFRRFFERMSRRNRAARGADRGGRRLLLEHLEERSLLSAALPTATSVGGQMSVGQLFPGLTPIPISSLPTAASVGGQMSVGQLFPGLTPIPISSLPTATSDGG